MQKTLLIIALLTLTIPAFASQSLLEGAPSGSQNLLAVKGHQGKKIQRRHYMVSFDVNHAQPAWVSYELSYDPDTFVYNRTDDYREDPALGNLSPTNEEYERTGFDRGHLAPAQDFAFNLRAMSESFFMSNMSPQRPDFNQKGLWRKLEDHVRDWSLGNFEKLIVVSGPVLSEPLVKIKKGSRLSLPKKFYKVILTKDEQGRWQAIGFVLPHLDILRDFTQYAVPVSKIESMTGLDFFSDLNDQTENQIERQFSAPFWFGQMVL